MAYRGYNFPEPNLIEIKPNPLGIFCIVLIASHSFYPFRVGNSDVDIIFQKVKDRNPAFTGGFHTDITTIVFQKPFFELLKVEKRFF